MTFKIQINRELSTPPFKQIEQNILEALKNGELQYGDRLPNERDFSEKLKVSRAVISRAYQELERKKIISRHRKNGTFIQREKVASNGVLSILMKHHDFTEIEMDYIIGIQQECHQHSFQVQFHNIQDEIDLSSLNSQGYIFLMTKEQSFINSDKSPCVFTMGSLTNHSMDWVHPDNLEGGRLAAHHLHELGHKNVFIYNETFFHRGSFDRVQGCSHYYLEQGIPLNKKWLPSPESPSSLLLLKKQLLSKSPPTAVFCCSDRDGVKVMQMAIENGLKVPEDLSIISYDGTSISQLFEKKLSCIVADRKYAGARAARLLIDKIEKRDHRNIREILTPVFLKEGDTTQAIS